jgi:Sulfatase
MGVRNSCSVTVLGGKAVEQVPVDTSPPKRAARRPPSRIPLSPTTAVLLAISFGLCAGYLDLLFMLFRKFCWDQEGFVRSGRDFLWTVPVAHVVLLLIPGAAIAALGWLRPRFVSMRAAAWLFAVLAIWAALLRLPLYGACTLLLAAGLGRPISAAVASRAWHPRTVRCTLAGLLGVLGVLAALSSGRQAIREHLAVAGLPPAPPGARNVVLIVWDTVRAYSLSAYGYSRNTTPNLARCAREGVLYNLAVAPAPWTYPSHSCFFTGQWPFKLNSQWKFLLDAPDPTLAEYLASRGYQTAGFAANTAWCNNETGLARGFTHFEDFSLTPRSLLDRTVPGKWILMHFLYRGNYHYMKWIDLRSRGARGINADFLGWLRQRRPDRPFFAFLNYFDAHEPYITPPGHEGRFGIRPRFWRSWALRPFLHSLPRGDRRPAGDPLSGRAGRHSRRQPRQPARPARNRGRPAGAFGRRTVPGPLVGGLLGEDTRASASGDHHPSPLGAGRRNCVPASASERSWA